MLDLLTTDGLHALVGDLPPNHERLWIPGGYLGTAATIEKMQELVSVGKRDFQIRTLVGNLIGKCEQKDYYCYAKACFDFCQKEIKYGFDPVGVELLESPRQILKSKVADCDSICILFATLCETLGLQSRFVTIKADTARPDEYSHVFCEVKVPRKGWVGADCTMKFPFGWQPDRKYERTNWPASKDSDGDHDTDEMAGMMGEPLVRGAKRGTPANSVNPEGEFTNEEALDVGTTEQLEVHQIDENEPGAWPHFKGPSPFFVEQTSPLSGMGALNLNKVETLKNVFDGTTAVRLREMAQMHRVELPKIISGLGSKATLLFGKAGLNAKDNVAVLQKQNAAALSRTLEAIQAYDKLAKTLKAVAMGYETPSPIGLSGVSETVIAGFSVLNSVSSSFQPFAVAMEKAENASLAAVESVQSIQNRSSQDWARWATLGIILAAGGYVLLKRRGR